MNNSEMSREYRMKRLHTHYDNLKVARNAPPEVIRAAYKTLSQKFHPDRHGGDTRSTQTFQLITAAYDVLSDPQRRRLHDEWIVRNERRLEREAAAAAEAYVKRPWNGRERRRQPWSTIKTSSSPAAVTAVGKLRLPAFAFWVAMILTTVILLMLIRT